MDDKESKKAALLQLSGNTTEEGRAAVMRQRELKNKKKALEKSMKTLKKLKDGDPGYAEAKEEVEAAQAAVAELEGKLAGAATAAQKSSSQPAAATTTSAAAETKPAAAPETKQKCDVESEEDRVLAQQTLDAMFKAARDRSAPSPSPPRLPLGYPTGAPCVHPQVVEATVLMEEMVVVGCNARTRAMIAAFKKLLRSTSALNTNVAATDLEAVSKVIDANYNFMCRQREATSGMRYVKETLMRRSTDLIEKNQDKSEEEGRMTNRQVMLHVLDNIEAELRMSLTSIVEERSGAHISATDTILVFGRSSVVECLLLHAAKSISFRVIVIDSAPLFEGRELTQRLSAAGISVTYGVLTACCTLLPKATRVFIGASSVLQNGDVFSRCGTAMVAACAKSFRRPVLCFSESYKFISEVWLGNIGQNHSATTGWRPQAEAGGYLYDLTPAEYVDMIICEMGCLHTSAIVAAIQDREMRDGFL
eukprot:gene8688-6109_t